MDYVREMVRMFRDVECLVFFFFFSSRRRHTRLQGDWSSDVCSSDLAADVLVMASLAQVASQYVFLLFGANGIGSNATSSWVLLGGIIWIVLMTAIRSEERRVGKECRSRWSPYH